MEVGVAFGIVTFVAAYFTITYKCCKKDKQKTALDVANEVATGAPKETTPLRWEVVQGTAPRF